MLFYVNTKSKKAGGIFLSAVEPLTLNMKDEENMAEWVKTNSPGIMTQLWPQIQSAVVSATSPHLLSITNTITIKNIYCI